MDRIGSKQGKKPSLEQETLWVAKATGCASGYGVSPKRATSDFNRKKELQKKAFSRASLNKRRSLKLDKVQKRVSTLERALNGPPSNNDLMKIIVAMMLAGDSDPLSALRSLAKVAEDSGVSAIRGDEHAGYFFANIDHAVDVVKVDVERVERTLTRGALAKMRASEP
ncbi:hypothetical protein HN588_01525 [Candidatus Bathyarchaeota archaeon]|jgi:hypothetical protein|nr:hypothetical protein [Candidatus Bathyarchaeota archaeon]